MKFLITGTAGFIGYHLALELLNKKHEVYGLDNLNNYYSSNIKKERLSLLRKFKKFKFKKINLINKKNFEKYVKNKTFDATYHLAAQPGVQYSLINRKSYFDNNIKSQFNILETIVKYRFTKQFIYGSSSSVYGENSNKKENSNLDKQESFYATSKKISELMASNYSHLYKFKSTGIRFFTVYGPFGRPDMAPLIFLKSVYKKKKIKLYNNGNSLRSFTYISDVVSCLIKLSNNKKFLKNKNNFHKIYNVGNDKNISTLSFLKLVEKFINMKAIIMNVKNRKGDVKKTKANINLAKKELNFYPKVSSKNGVKKMCHWYLKSSMNFK